MTRPERDAEMQTGGQEAPVTHKRSAETDAETRQGRGDKCRG